MKNTKLSKSDISVLKIKLKKRRKKKEKELKTISDLLKDQKAYIKRNEMDYDSDASKIRNREMLQSMRRRTKSKLKKYEVALDKIKNKTYGICEKSGRAISKERLMVLPEARTCIKHK